MNKLCLLVFGSAILHQTIWAQTSFQVQSFQPTIETFKYLLLTNKEIEDNDTINEKILDLAEPMLLDSVVDRRIQHHKLGPLGWFISTFGGFNWRTVSKQKEKFVGTVMGDGRSGEVEYTEYDIKFKLGFHLQAYFDKIFRSYNLQRKYHKQDIRPSHKRNFHQEPYERDATKITPTLYHIGTELTPTHAFIPPLNYKFFPTLPEGGDLKSHVNFGSAHPSMGFYGVACVDCNHDCHPELHPYEWIYWLNLKEENSADKTWLIGLFHEASNRMKNWSKNPMTGEIKVPFAFSKTEKCKMEIMHLVYNRFLNEEIAKLNLPDTTIKTQIQNTSAIIRAGTNEITAIGITFNEPLRTNALQYWFSDINYDETSNLISGYFHMAISVKDLYTTRIKFIYEQGK